MAKIPLLLILGTLFVPSSLFAQVVITEIMYDLPGGSDTGREWIEVRNRGLETVPLASYVLLDSGARHSLRSVRGEAVLLPGDYAVIASDATLFLQDWPQYTGQLFDSAFALSNDGEEIGIINSGEIQVDAVRYAQVSGNGTGDSLQRSDTNVFYPGIPTPGSGIPQDGLRMSETLDEGSQRAKSKQVEVSSPTPIVGDIVAVEERELLPEIPAQKSTLWWWLAPLCIAGIATTGVVFARHAQKSEWQIIDDSEELS